jgi:hypothetical protein
MPFWVLLPLHGKEKTLLFVVTDYFNQLLYLSDWLPCYLAGAFG